MEKEVFENKLHVIMERSAKEPERMNASLGLRLLSCSTEGMGSTEFEYLPKTGHENPYGGIHGGIVAALFDTCMGISIAARTGYFVTTTDLSVSYLRALIGGRYRIRVDFTHLGKRLASVNAKIFDTEKNELCATCMGTFMLLDTDIEVAVRV